MRAFALFMVILGCDSPYVKPPLPALSPYPSCPSCKHTQFVVSKMVLPQSNATAMQFGCDINGDGEIDNQLGKALGAARAVCQDFDTQGVTDAAFQSGNIILLYDVTSDPSGALLDGLRVFVGAHDASDGLSAPAFYMGQGRFTAAFEAGSGMGLNAQGSFGPNDGIAQLALFRSQPTLVFPLQRSYVTGFIGATAIQNGRLCGAVDAQAVVTMILPQLADFMSAEIKRRTNCANVFQHSTDADHSCDTDPNCVPSSAAECHCITVGEVESDSYIRALLTPDLDLDPTKTNPFVDDPTDPTYQNDALSMGVGITANAAAFPLP